MEAENHIFFYRVGQLPMVKAVSERAISAYETTKHSNRLFNATLQLAENSVKYASEVEAVKKMLQSQLVHLANQVAVKQLNKIEQNYPIVKKEPNEVWIAGKDYYDQTRLKNNVDKIYSVKAYGENKITDTKTFVADKLTNLLDYSDSMVDKYVVVHGENEINGQALQCDDTLSYFDRVHCISGKFYHGVKYRAGEKYDVTKEYVIQTLGDFHVAMLLIEYAKNTAAWTNEKTHAVLSTAQEQAKLVWHEIQRRTEPIGNRTDAIVLTLVQTLAANVAAMSQLFVKYSTPYLPENVEKTVVASADYANEVRDSFAKANSLGDIRKEVIAEAKEKIGYIQDGLSKGIDYLVEFPPVSWLKAGPVLLEEKTVEMNVKVEKYEVDAQPKIEVTTKIEEKIIKNTTSENGVVYESLIEENGVY